MMTMRNMLFNDEQREVQIFLCCADASMNKRICSALKIASGITKNRLVEIRKIDALMSYELSKNDLLIVDKVSVAGFAVRQLLSMMEQEPQIIWISSDERFQLVDLVNQIQSTV